ncbi:signal peptide peptidase 2-like isoform X2 [Arachis duranensis]|uniref:Signal peptide peptidase 2-like isoform X2 n=1 Tax=Arachis duranensis TaxID=130453 RepID=A0A9C6TRK4_ARADU|nr:signal peptide peptidase 2-like isoform X2 [Arachis duranensis]XP_052119182.1 signal peptide peptidase 2-like isoform X2 [Arachis duranensis]
MGICNQDAIKQLQSMMENVNEQQKITFQTGLFVYDIFWDFFTPVMVSAAKSFDAPIKLLSPTADSTRPFSMLGLGDIVIPGIFIALALRFDVSRGKQAQYFKSSFLGYTIGLALTIFVMNWFQAAQMTGSDMLFYTLYLL